MNRSISCTAALFVAATMLACGSSGGDDNVKSDGPDAASTDPTFTRVFSEVITNTNCSGPLCHMSTAVGGFMLGPKDTLYNELVGQPASGPKCGPGTASSTDGGASDAGAGDAAATSYIRVIAGDPDHSLLYLKLAGSPPCGDAMPVGRMLSDAQITLVHDWIQAGANND